MKNFASNIATLKRIPALVKNDVECFKKDFEEFMAVIKLL